MPSKSEIETVLAEEGGATRTGATVAKSSSILLGIVRIAVRCHMCVFFTARTTEEGICNVILFTNGCYGRKEHGLIAESNTIIHSEVF